MQKKIYFSPLFFSRCILHFSFMCHFIFIFYFWSHICIIGMTFICICFCLIWLLTLDYLGALIKFELWSIYNLSLKNILFIYFLEQRREGEGEEGKHQCVVASRTPPTGYLASNPGMGLNWEYEPEIFWFAGGHSSTEPHQSGLQSFF